MEEARAFNNRPALLASNPIYNARVVDNLQAAQGRWMPDDAFYLMTDALAAWFLAEAEKGERPWAILRDLGPRDQIADFIELVSRNRNKFSILDAAFDLTGGLGPDEGFGILVPVGEEASDGTLQLGNAGETAAPNRLLADNAEPAFD